ncbi:MAG: hypothetical protein ATN31_05675 [Candidatus Epulonipiscioides saccharophilum]|nr:MAG: hypothetical protein ATN31_05675 [Epulopiscium sp. AS2M-Bin001]
MFVIKKIITEEYTTKKIITETLVPEDFEKSSDEVIITAPTIDADTTIELVNPVGKEVVDCEESILNHRACVCVSTVNEMKSAAGEFACVCQCRTGNISNKQANANIAIEKTRT